jgi:hypothetical protein
MERAFPKTLLRRKNIAKRGGTRLPLVGNEGGKKIGKNLSYPLTGAGLLMEDAEAQRKARDGVIEIAPSGRGG